MRLVPDAVSAGISPKIKPQTTDAANVNASTVASIADRAPGAGLANVRRRRRAETEAPPREQQPAKSTGEREDQAFGQQLANERGPASAERGTNRQFALARGCPRQQEIGDVRAGDEKHEGDRAGEHERAPAECHLSVARRSGTTFDVHPVLKSGNICVRLAETCVISACACSTAMPGLSRPTTVSDRPRGVRDCAENPIGSQTSTFLSRNEKPDGMTPTIVKGVPCDTTGWPRMFGSPRKRRFHSRSLMTTRRAAGDVLSGCESATDRRRHAEDRERARPRSTAPEAPRARRCR